MPVTNVAEETGVGGGSNFTRNERTTSSVRLRKKRDELNAGGAGLQMMGRPGAGHIPDHRKRNRHSGDFSLFTSYHHQQQQLRHGHLPQLGNLQFHQQHQGDNPGHYGRMEPPQTGAGGSGDRRGQPGPKSGVADFNYITFPNGVPLVQELHVDSHNRNDGGHNHRRSNVNIHSASAAAAGSAGPSPVRVTLRDSVAGGAGAKLTGGSRAVSALNLSTAGGRYSPAVTPNGGMSNKNGSPQHQMSTKLSAHHRSSPSPQHNRSSQPHCGHWSQGQASASPRPSNAGQPLVVSVLGMSNGIGGCNSPSGRIGANNGMNSAPSGGGEKQGTVAEKEMGGHTSASVHGVGHSVNNQCNGMTNLSNNVAGVDVGAGVELMLQAGSRNSIVIGTTHSPTRVPVGSASGGEVASSRGSADGNRGSAQKRTPQATGAAKDAVRSRTPGSAEKSSSARKQEKACTNEFEFKRMSRCGADMAGGLHPVASMEPEDERSFIERMVQRELLCDSASEASIESGIFSTGSSQESPQKGVRRPGLGRRAITQVNLKEERNLRKNSYNSALARSQENLVKTNPQSEGGCTSPDDVFGGAIDGVAEAGGAVGLGDHPLSRHHQPIKKGLLWQQRDKLFSRWKERYFILTNDFLQCFKKETSKITDMGGFIFKIKLSEVDTVELLDKRGYLTICLSVAREGKVYLRNTEGIREWYHLIKEHITQSKSRKSNRSSAIFADRRQNTDSSGLDAWLANRKLAGKFGAFSDSTPEVNKSGTEKERITLEELSSLYRREEQEEEEMRNRKKINRLSLMTDVELPDLGANSKLGLDIERGIFLRKNRLEGDSGNNSLNTNRSNTSTGSSHHSSHNQTESSSSYLEEEEEEDGDNIHRNVLNDLGEGNSPAGNKACVKNSRSHHVAKHAHGSAPADPLTRHVGKMTVTCGETTTAIGPQPDVTGQHHQQQHSPLMKVLVAGGEHNNNKNVIEVRYRERSRDSPSKSSPSGQERRRSSHVNRLQITHV